MSAGPARIEDYALVGDLQTAALVCRNGSIDWCCLPRFDSSACFAALLGGPENGRWHLAPTDAGARIARRYRPQTLILETTFETDGGSVRVVDFMPPRGSVPDIVRVVEGLRGSVEMGSELVIRFDYGRVVPWVRRIQGALVAIAGPDALCLRSPVEPHGVGMTTVSTFHVAAGERVPFVLTWFPSHEQPPGEADADTLLADTADYWTEWSSRCRGLGDYHDEVLASLRVLKALTYAPTGGIVAAATTSLPERLGGVRNWDYRYCWLRDASLTLVAMLRAGYRAEAVAWRDWLLRAIAGDPADVQIMYGVAGERRLDERELEWLAGYEGSRPVRTGNAASRQLQLDVYGSVLDAAYLTRAHGVPADDHAWTLLRALLDWLEDGWRHADSGLWEMRGPPREFTHSRLSAWLAFDRALRLHGEFGRSGPAERWRELRETIRSEILERAWSERKQAFAQSYGSDDLDASVLLMARWGFLAPHDPRFASTVTAIRRELGVDGLLRRYDTGSASTLDGLPAGEGAFLACSFWLVDALALRGEHTEARALFERLLRLRNDVGLLSEEYDPAAGRMLGNFPQALSHLALVDSGIGLGARPSLA